MMRSGRLFRVGGWVVGLLGVAFAIQFVLWYQDEPTWSSNVLINGAVIRVAGSLDTMPRATIAVGAMTSDSIFLAERQRYVERETFSELPFVGDRPWVCYSVGYEDSLRIGRCRNEQDSLRLQFACWPKECASLRRAVSRTVEELLAERRRQPVP
jgi:hypothetical protein